jgi:hypothetical protein
MLTTFLIHLAAGMTWMLFLLSPGRTIYPTPEKKLVTNASFFRTQMLVVFGLIVGAILWQWQIIESALLAFLLASAFACLLGIYRWSLEQSRGADVCIGLTGIGLLVCVGLLDSSHKGMIGGVSSSLLLGASFSAMLMGHNYLIAPNLTMTPLNRLLAALAMALVVRMIVEGGAFVLWISEHELDSLTGDAVLWLPVRWLVGLVAPAVLCWMACQTARIRSTQSATGILYVVVIFCFVGEVMAQVLRPTQLSW